MFSVEPLQQEPEAPSNNATSHAAPAPRDCARASAGRGLLRDRTILVLKPLSFKERDRARMGLPRLPPGEAKARD